MNLLGSQKYVFPVNKFTLNKDSLLIGFLEISPCVPDLFRFFMTTLYLSLEMAIFKYPYKKTGGFCSATILNKDIFSATNRWLACNSENIQV